MLKVYAFSLYLLKPFCIVEPALCKHVTSWRSNVRARQPDSNASGFEQVASTRTSHAECTPPLATGTSHLSVYSFNRRWEPIAFKIGQKYSHFFGRCICIHSFKTQIIESDSLPSRFEEISRGSINGRDGGNHRAHRIWKAEMMERETRWKQTIGSLIHEARPLWQELLHSDN